MEYGVFQNGDKFRKSQNKNKVLHFRIGMEGEVYS